MPSDSKSTLWKNVSELMRAHYGKENLTRFAADVGIGPGTATRIKEAETSVGLDVLERIAKKFDLDPWQLMVPGLDVKNPPVLDSGHPPPVSLPLPDTALVAAIRAAIRAEGGPGIVKVPDDRNPPRSQIVRSKQLEARRRSAAPRSGSKKPRKEG